MASVVIKDLENYPDLKGGEELIANLLDEAGYSHDVSWQVRWAETCKCDSNSPAIQVLNIADNGWAIRLVCKPKHGHSHNFKVFLYVPNDIKPLLGSQYNITLIFTNLQKVAQDVSDKWKSKREVRKTEPKPQPVQQQPQTVIEIPTWSKSLSALFDNTDAVRFVLLIFAANENNTSSLANWREKIIAGCGWQDRKPQSVSRIINRLEDEEYIQPSLYRNTKVAYALTPKARHLIADYVLPKGGERRKAILPVNDALQRLATAAKRVVEIPQERERLKEEIAEREARLRALLAEEAAIESLLSQPEISGLIQHLKGLSQRK